jgi:general stress protein 26
MSHSDLENYLKRLKDFDSAMLVTRRGAELRARPMAIAECSEDGRVSFLTSIESDKIGEITDESIVNLALQNASQFMSISGNVLISRETSKIDKLWSASYQPWFPEGKNDPTITVLIVVPTYAEYWDMSGGGGIKALFELGKAAIGGETPKFDDDVHKKIDFPTSNRDRST